MNGEFNPNSQTITTSNDNNRINGVRVFIIDPIGTKISNNTWNIDTLQNTDWSLRISLDSKWRFHSLLPSAITIDIYGQNGMISNNNLDLLLSVDLYNQTKYYSLLIDLDNNNNNIISPGCDININNPSQSMLNGDVYIDMNTNNKQDKKCNVMLNDNNICVYEAMSTSSSIINQWPLQFTIKNYPNSGNGYSVIQFISNDGSYQICSFNEEILSTTELDLWLTASNDNEQFVISQFDINSYYISTISPTNIPTIIPSISPSNIPTPIPSITPSKIPSNLPTTLPSKSPTNIPTVIPSISPSNIPTSTPSTTPSKSPSNLPTTLPSKSPTNLVTNIPSISSSVIPSIFPSKIPTNIPTKTPTSSPILQRTENPSTNLPSFNPTKYPTNTPSISTTTTTSQQTTNPMSNSPSLNPTKSPSNPITNIPTISPFNTITVSPTIANPTDSISTIYPTTSKPTTSSTTTSISRTLHPSIASTITPIVTSIISSSIASVTSTTVNGIDFKKSDAKTVSKETIIPEIVGIILLISIFIAILDIIHSGSKKECNSICGSHRSDEFNYQIIVIIALRICDMITDITVFFIMCLYHESGDNYGSLLLLIVCSAASLLTVWTINVFSMCKIVKLPVKTEGPLIWFKKYMLFFVFLILITCDSYLSVNLIHSNIFGMSLFNSGHSSVDIERIKGVKLATILFQNIPQIIIQFIFVMIIKDYEVLIVLSMIISFVLSIPLLISWYLSNTNNKSYIWLEYDIEATLISPSGGKPIDGTSVMSISNDKIYEMGQIMQYIGCKRILRKKLALILGVSSSKLEISYIGIDRDNGCKIHIVQQIPRTYHSISYDADIMTLYDDKYIEIAKEIKTIYHISLDWTVVCTVKFNHNNKRSITEMSNIQHIYQVNSDENDDDDGQLQHNTHNTHNAAIDSLSTNLEMDVLNKPFPIYPIYTLHGHQNNLINNRPIINTGFSTSTIDEELYGSHSNKSQHFKKLTNGTSAGKTTVGDHDDDDDDEEEENKNNEYETNDNGSFDDKLILIPNAKHRKIYSEGPKINGINIDNNGYSSSVEDKKHRTLYSEGPKLRGNDDKIFKVNENDELLIDKNPNLGYNNNASLTVPNAMPLINQYLSSSTSIKNGKHRKIYSEGPKKINNNNNNNDDFSPISVENSGKEISSKICDLFDIGNGENAYNTVGNMQTIKDDSD